MLTAFSITPLGTRAPSADADAHPDSYADSDSVGASVAEAVRLVRESGLPNETNAMFTNVEGEWDEVMALIRSCVDKVLESAPRVSIVIKIDERPAVDGALTSKVATVERHLAAEPGRE